MKDDWKGAVAMHTSNFSAMQKQSRFYKTLANLLLLPICSILSVITVSTTGTYLMISSRFSLQIHFTGYKMHQPEFSVIFSILAVVAVLPFIACYLVARFTKKPIVAMIATAVGLVLTVADTAYLVYWCILYLMHMSPLFLKTLPDLVAHLVLLGIAVWCTVLSVGLFRDSRCPAAVTEDETADKTKKETLS